MTSYAKRVYPFALTRGTGVRATQSIGGISEGDTGHVVAAWIKPIVCVKWDGKGSMVIHRKRLALHPEADHVSPDTVASKTPRAI